MTEHVAEPGGAASVGQTRDLYATGGIFRRRVSGLSGAQGFSAGRKQKLHQLEENTYELY